MLNRLASHEPWEAWTTFLESYSSDILQIVQVFEREPDCRTDCFLFVCQQLSKNQFRRLRRFQPGGRARFTTWLQVVVRNLCLDWHRQEYGRQRAFQSVGRLDPLDQEVFREVYSRGLSQEDCFSRLRFTHASLTHEEVGRSLERIQRALTPRQLWLLSTRRPLIESLEGGRNGDQEASRPQIVDPRPDPESLAALKEQEDALDRALGRLYAPERLLLLLRFDQGLTLLEIARLTELKDAQTADRRIRDVLEKLRRELTSAGESV